MNKFCTPDKPIPSLLTCHLDLITVGGNTAQSCSTCCRDEAHNKMAALKERREKDMQMHNSEMKDLLRMISHDEKIKEFIQIKSNERLEYKQEKARRIKLRCRPPLCPVIPPGGRGMTGRSKCCQYAILENLSN